MLRTILAACLIAGPMATTAHAFSEDKAERCAQTAAALPEQQARLAERQETLLRLKAAAEAAGDAYEDAQELSALSADYRQEAQAKRVAFDRKRAEVAELNLQLQQQAEAFNNRVDWYNRTCASGQ